MSDEFQDLQRELERRRDQLPAESAPMRAVPSWMPEPTFEPCTRCGELTTGGGACWECQQADLARERRRDDLRALDAALRTHAPRYADASFRNLQALLARVTPPTAVQVAPRKPADAPLVVLVGAPGAGKTTLGVAILRAYASEIPGVSRFIRAKQLGRARIEHRAGDGEPAIVEDAIGAAALMLDDVGAETHERTLNAVPDIVDERHVRMAKGGAPRPTIITTGLTREELVARYDAGFARRVLEGALVIRLSAKGARMGGA